MNTTKIEIVSCPQCNHDAVLKTLEDTVAHYTGEYIDEGEPEIETVTAHGWTLQCQNPECGFGDCEPPTW